MKNCINLLFNQATRNTKIETGKDYRICSILPHYRNFISRRIHVNDGRSLQTDNCSLMWYFMHCLLLFPNVVLNLGIDEYYD